MQKENQTYKVAPADRLAGVSEYYFSKKLKEVARLCLELELGVRPIARACNISTSTASVYVEKLRGLNIPYRELEEMEEEAQKKWEEMPLEEHLEHYMEQGIDKKEAMKKVAKDRGISKRDVYQALLKKE